MKFSKSPYGLFKQVADKYGLASKTIRRIWLRGQETNGVVLHRVRGNKGRARSEAQLDDINAKLNAIPHIEDKDLRSIAKAVDVPLSTLHKYMATGIVKPKGQANTRPKRQIPLPAANLPGIITRNNPQTSPSPPPTLQFESVESLETMDRLPPFAVFQPSELRHIEALEQENERLRQENYQLVQKQHTIARLQSENDTLKSRNAQLTLALRELRVHYNAPKHVKVAMYEGIQPSPVPCPVGMYRIPGNGVTLTECQYCPRGVYGNLPGLTSSACTAPCPKGTLGAKSIDDCKPCPKGTYGMTSGMTTRTCTGPCPYGTYSMTDGLISASSCLSCPSNYRGPNGHRGNNLNFYAAGGYNCDTYYSGTNIVTGRDVVFAQSQDGP
ncbi:hypothetical protein THRCLA_04647 [Thraustotheca clavata]|uniref:Tyrosine-protein kinase ephrin type A/B receptor-like domain-containing protein n=1 Tax=Thraustotheca clavata TaxID=74557 RepID=A0A1V9ZYF2_9STRA|nr:hypothetical protein THRCLA_04647 [Thraustotheca clavata]